MGEYTKDIDSMTFSFSRCHGFETCKYEWYLNYLLKDSEGNRIYENEQNFYAAFGKLCHELLEKLFKGEIDEKTAFEIFCDRYEEDAGYLGADMTKDKYYMYGYDYFNTLDTSWIKDYEILGIEKECRFNVKTIPFVGYIDLLLRNKANGDIIVIDHKSADYPIGKKGKVLKSKKDDFESYKRQLYLYSQQVFNEYGKYPTKLVWNYFKVQKWLGVPFIYEEYIEANEWAVQIVGEIREEEDFIPSMDYFYCNNLCGFRNSCDYLTLGD